MPSFSYEARKTGGRAEQGTMEGESAQAVARQLREMGYYVLDVRPTRREKARRPGDAALRRVVAPVLFPVNSKALAGYFASLRALLSAGMNMTEAMLTLSERTRNSTLKRAAKEMAEAAMSGRPMSSVMGRHPSAFNAATMAAIEAGEQTGLLEQTAARLAHYFDRQFELEQTYRWHTFYPKILVLAALLIPTVPTLVLGSFDLWLDLVVQRTLPLLAVILLLWYGWRVVSNVPLLRIGLDRLRLLVPWFGSLARRMATARWARALSMLLEAGVPVHRALVAAAGASGNRAMESALVRAAAGVLRGEPVADVLRASGELPAMALDMISTAERAGSFEGALDKIADYYESETEVGGKQTAVAIGVLAYLVIAGIIAFIVITAWQSYGQEFHRYLE